MNFKCLLASLFLFALVNSSQAQWLSQSFDLVPGWNAVFLHVDASHDTIDSMVADDPGNPILEVWRWNSPSTVQFIEDPQQPVGTGSEWSSWVRGQANLGLQRLVGDSAYLVNVGTNVGSYIWQIKGQPVAPRPVWNISGLNLLGFSSVPVSPPNFDTFLATSPDLQPLTTEIYQYVGGPLGPGNPLEVTALRNVLVSRGKAFWIRADTTFNRYFGPFEVFITGDSGIEFGDTLSTYRLRLRNLTDAPLTVSLDLESSEEEPVGETDIMGTPSILVRGSLNPTNFTYGYTGLVSGSPQQWTLAARDQEGSEIEVVLGLDRVAMTGNIGDLLAGILRFTDSLGHSQVDVPVSASVSASTGLWVGGAAVMQVGQYLKSYETGAPNPLLVTNNGVVITNDLVLGPNLQYVVTSINTNLAATPSAYPLRLIVQNPDAGSAVLLQRVYYGLDGSTNPVVATYEGALNRDYINEARRISTSHLPWTAENRGWIFNGLLGVGETVTASVTNLFNNQVSNPFLHTYHPDHDNLNARFSAEVPRGRESYTVIRDITLNVTPPGDDFESRTAGGRTLSGDYVETIRMLGQGADVRQFETRGFFTLNLITDVAVLTTAP